MQYIHRAVGNGLGGIALHGHLHVRLTGTYPHLADKHVVELKLFAVADSDGIRSAGSRSGDGDVPSAVAVRLAEIGLVVPGGVDLDGLLGVCRAPQPDVCLTLEHHAAVEDGGHPYLGICRCRCRDGKDSKKCFFHRLTVLYVG